MIEYGVDYRTPYGTVTTWEDEAALGNTPSITMTDRDEYDLSYAEFYVTFSWEAWAILIEDAADGVQLIKGAPWVLV